MSDGSKIQWLARPGTKPATWNPVTGCTKLSPGCAHCYAERMAQRLGGRFGYPADEPFRVTLHGKVFEPHRWAKPRTVFACSMGDLWHPDVKPAWRREIFAVSRTVHQHIYIFLTKRPERVDDFPVLPNHWLGTSIENQVTADERIPCLLKVPAAVRFVSCEPLLEPIELDADFLFYRCPACGRHEPHCDCGLHGEWTLPNTLDWLIIGAETGPGRRSCKIEWVKSLVDQADGADVPVFVKSLEIDGKVTSNLMDWPEWARRREWPVV